MNSVSFGGTNLDTYGLHLPYYEIPAPEPFLYMEEIAGRNGLIDLSNAFGDVRYKNREWDLTFVTKAPCNWHTVASNVMSLVHGKRLDFIFDDDPTHTWNGRCSVTSFVSESGKGSITVHVSSDPFKLKQSNTVVSRTGAGSVTLSNSDMPVVPTITTTAAMGISFTLDGNEYSAQINGTATVPQLVLPKGNTVVTVTGTGKITFTYREGLL
jgi:phage-related protein